MTVEVGGRLDGRSSTSQDLEVIQGGESFSLLGIEVSPRGLTQALLDVEALIDAEQGADVHLCNAYTLSLALGDGEYHEVLRGARLNLVDGVPVAYAAFRRAGRTRRDAFREARQRASRGPSLMRELLLRDTGSVRHALLGGHNATRDALVARFASLNPVLDLRAMADVPYRNLDADDISDFLRELSFLRPAVVWVGLGTPKQDLVCAQLAAEYPAVFIAVGAAFDFLAGSKPEAPIFLQSSGLEWLYRLATEPRRLWKRYTIHAVRFMLAVTRHHL